VDLVTNNMVCLVQRITTRLGLAWGFFSWGVSSVNKEFVTNSYLDGSNMAFFAFRFFPLLSFFKPFFLLF